jgi:hypothetical protein
MFQCLFRREKERRENRTSIVKLGRTLVPARCAVLWLVGRHVLQERLVNGDATNTSLLRIMVG